MPYARANLIASLIEEEDFSASLGEVLHQIARRVQRVTFSKVGRDLAFAALNQVDDALQSITSEDWESRPMPATAAERLPGIVALRERCLQQGTDLPPMERGAILALLGSAERTFLLIERIDAERRSSHVSWRSTPSPSLRHPSLIG
jgi:phosphate:Na+ symporter